MEDYPYQQPQYPVGNNVPQESPTSTFLAKGIVSTAISSLPIGSIIAIVMAVVIIRIHVRCQPVRFMSSVTSDPPVNQIIVQNALKNVKTGEKHPLRDAFHSLKQILDPIHKGLAVVVFLI